MYVINIIDENEKKLVIVRLELVNFEKEVVWNVLEILYYYNMFRIIESGWWLFGIFNIGISVFKN